jgi:iron complex transport system ATP-binding protein
VTGAAPAHLSAESLLRVRGLDVALGGTPILHGAELDAAAGRLVAVVGPNGAGKSTLARAAAGLLRPTAGSITWGGEDIQRLSARRRARVRAFVPQRASVPDGVCVREAVELGRAPHVRVLARPTRVDDAAVDEAMTRTDVHRLAERRLATLSGGELQRVQLAVALAQDAPALIADEPTAHLDLGATSTIARLLRTLADGGLAVVLVVHDLALAAALADDVVVMCRGRTVAAGPPATVLTPALIADVWRVDAALEQAADGRTALHVSWLGDPPDPLSSPVPSLAPAVGPPTPESP